MTPADADSGVLRRARELETQSGLADPRLARHEHERALAVAKPGQTIDQPVQLAPSADEFVHHRPGDRGRARWTSTPAFAVGSHDSILGAAQESVKGRHHPYPYARQKTFSLPVGGSKEAVRRFVDEAVNGGRDELIDGVVGAGAVDRVAAPLADARGGEQACGRGHARGGDHVTLEERLAEALRAAHATGSAECPACGGAMVPATAGAGAGADAAACGDCGSRLSY